MSKQLYNDQEIIQYLLGSLPEAEAERLDELSFADAEFADALSAAEKDLVDGYVHGELTGVTLEKFEAHYLASPRRRENVEFAHAFQTYAEKYSGALAGSESRGSSVTKRKVSSSFPSWAVFPIPRSAAQWGFATALLALLAAGTWFLFENARQAPASIASFVLAPQLRGAGQIQTLSIPAKTDAVKVELELEPIDYPAYEVVLLDQSDNRTLWRSGKLASVKRGNGRALSISLPADLLQSQNYLLRVTGVSPEGVPEIVSDYPIQVVKQ